MSQSLTTQSDLRPIEDLPEKQQNFVHLLAAGIKPAKAYVMAGYSGEGETAAANARKLARKLRPHVEQEVMNRAGQQVPIALNVAEDLLSSKEVDPKLKWSVAKWFLDSAGIAAPTKVEHTHKRAEEMQSDDIKDELRALLAKAVVGEVIEHEPGSD